MKGFVKGFARRFGYDIVRRGNSNDSLSDHLANVFSKYDIDCVLDVGANSGQYGRFLREIGFRGHIVSFEPVRSVFRELEARAGADKNWSCHNLALGEIEEEKFINVYESSVFSSFLEATDYSKEIWNSLNTVSAELVQIASLDSIFERIKQQTRCRNFYLKLDTQGFDINVFRGARNSLSEIVALQSEVSLISVYRGMPDAYAVLNEFHDHHYFISGMYPINRDASLAVIEYDCVLVRRLLGAAI